MNPIVDRLLEEAEHRGVTLSVTGSTLAIDGPAGALDERFVGLLRANEAAVSARLRPPPASWLVDLAPSPPPGATPPGATPAGAPPVDAPPVATVVLLPAAGAGPRTYRSWADAAPPGLEVVGVLAPGREERFDEPAATDVAAVAGPVAEAVAGRALATGRRFALFGHSTGGAVAHHVARLLAAGPAADLFRLLAVAGSPPPDLVAPDPGELGDAALMAALAEWGGTPPEVLADPDFAALFLPTLRADLTLNASCHRPLAPGERHDVALLALAGRRDRTPPPDQVRPWSAWAATTFAYHEFDGDHFFPVAFAPEVLRLVATHLGAAAAQSARAV